MAGPIDVTITARDLVVTNGDLVTIDGAERVAQSVEMRIQALKGEWFIDRTFGLPYFESVLGQKMITTAEFDAVTKATILEVSGVNRIVSFESSFNQASRNWAVEFVADTIYGPISYEGVVP
jgi:hypothetical protein